MQQLDEFLRVTEQDYQPIMEPFIPVYSLSDNSLVAKVHRSIWVGCPNLLTIIITKVNYLHVQPAPSTKV